MNSKTNRTVAVYAIIAWMVINAIFMVLELTVFGDSEDLNNSILLILSLVSIAGLASMRKAGVALATFSLTYAFAFNAFNVIYFHPTATLLNGTSAIINGIAIVYLFKSILQNKFL